MNLGRLWAILTNRLDVEGANPQGRVWIQGVDGKGPWLVEAWSVEVNALGETVLCVDLAGELRRPGDSV